MKDKLKSIRLLRELNTCRRRLQHNAKIYFGERGITYSHKNSLYTGLDQIKYNLDLNNLTIFYAYPNNNWEKDIETDIELCDSMSVQSFDWRLKGFNELTDQNNWLVHQRDEMNAALIQELTKCVEANLNVVFLGYVTEFTLSKSACKSIKELGIPMLMFNWDDRLGFTGRKIHNVRTGPASIARHFDRVLTNSPLSAVRYQRKGANGVFWPEGGLFYEYVEHKEESIDVLFVGKKYGIRSKYVDYLVENGVNVACFGEGWENSSISYKDYVSAVRKSKIVLGFSQIAHSDYMCLKGRDFEIPLMSTCYITQYHRDLDLVFDVGTEIAAYSDKKDLLIQIIFLLENKPYRDEMRRRGYDRCVESHTWSGKVKRIVESLNG